MGKLQNIGMAQRKNDSSEPQVATLSTPMAKHDAALARLSKGESCQLADGLLTQDTAVIEKCIAFILMETRGDRHGRARAAMCRRLKHCPISSAQRLALLTCILGRLSNGIFAEQFKDQLRLAIALDPWQTHITSQQCLANSKSYVRRYAAWLLGLQRVRQAVSNPLER